MVFLHGFPEAAFIWDELLEHFAQPEHGGYRCVAPNLRGFEKSSSPTEVAAYRAHLLVQDIAAARRRARARTAASRRWSRTTGAAPSAGAMANQHADKLGRLVIINSPHPGTFTRELQNNPAQQAASAYMNFLARPDAEALLSADDYRRMWPFFTLMKAGPDGFGWLTETVKDAVPRGLGRRPDRRLQPLPRHADEAGRCPASRRRRSRRCRASGCTVDVPTLVLWALDDAALLPGLLEGLEDYVPQLELKKVPGATHWIVHEQPQFVAERDRGLPAADSVDRRRRLPGRVLKRGAPSSTARAWCRCSPARRWFMSAVSAIDVVGREVLPGRQHLDLVALAA